MKPTKGDRERAEKILSPWPNLYMDCDYDVLKESIAQALCDEREFAKKIVLARRQGRPSRQNDLLGNLAMRIGSRGGLV